MSLGAGSYLIVSCCMVDKYDLNLIKKFTRKIQEWNVDIVDLTYREINPNIVNYDIIERYDDFPYVEKKVFIENDLNKYVLLNLDFILQENIPVNCCIYFFDNYSYEICLMFNYSELIEFEQNENKLQAHARLIEEKAFSIFSLCSIVQTSAVKLMPLILKLN